MSVRTHSLALLAAAGLLLGGTAFGSECARVSVVDVAPRAQKLYPAVLIELDGALPGTMTSETWRITPGKHTLKVAEAIAPHEFNMVQLRQRDGRFSDRYKTLEIVAEPGITYRLAAKFHPDQRQKIRSGDYWEPVIWKESRESCN